MYVIHPSQVAVANEVFSPSRQELSWAREVLSRYEAVTEQGEGAFLDSDGLLVDLAHVRTAQQIVESFNRFGTVAQDQM
jgi:citrate lyase subunit beta/citryl-CoA lyase